MPVSADKINELRKQIMELRAQVAALQKVLPRQAVDDYSFETDNGLIRLSELFGDKQSLFVVHNMGISCHYCMLWADGFNGVANHLQDRAAFVISSPDPVKTQQTYRLQRGWELTMVSVEKNSFAQDMGFKTDEGYIPGVSVFEKDADSIVRVASTMFGPGDDFCAVWHLFDLLPAGANGWQPQPDYP